MTDIPETVLMKARPVLAYALTAANSGQPERALEIVARALIDTNNSAEEALEKTLRRMKMFEATAYQTLSKFYFIAGDQAKSARAGETARRHLFSLIGDGRQNGGAV